MSGTPQQKQKKVTKKVRWTPEEDEILRNKVMTYRWEKGPTAVDWKAVAAVTGRSTKQCRERFLNVADPSINRGPWTLTEVECLFRTQAEIGNKWSTIAQRLTGRPETATKNTYYAILRREKRREFAAAHGLPVPASVVEGVSTLAIVQAAVASFTDVKTSSRSKSQSQSQSQSHSHSTVTPTAAAPSAAAAAPASRSAGVRFPLAVSGASPVVSVSASGVVSHAQSRKRRMPTAAVASMAAGGTTAATTFSSLHFSSSGDRVTKAVRLPEHLMPELENIIMNPAVISPEPEEWVPEHLRAPASIVDAEAEAEAEVDVDGHADSEDEDNEDDMLFGLAAAPVSASAARASESSPFDDFFAAFQNQSGAKKVFADDDTATDLSSVSASVSDGSCSGPIEPLSAFAAAVGTVGTVGVGCRVDVDPEMDAAFNALSFASASGRASAASASAAGVHPSAAGVLDTTDDDALFGNFFADVHPSELAARPIDDYAWFTEGTALHVAAQ